ncbi:MAG: LPS assembly protein LptD [Candidatus Omnitrophica bacterium]|nr:LPS assembly protein LptD [Candidatus Omnitrophota bacterium]
MYKIIFLILLILILFIPFFLYAQDIKEPIIVNGDRVEYSTDKREVVAEGNVSVVYKDVKLTCKKIKVDLYTQEAVAEGDVCIKDTQGLIYAEKMKYNFSQKTGEIIKAKVEFTPYYGKGEITQRLSEDQYKIINGYVTTCDLDRPHYRISSKNIHIYPENKIVGEGVKLHLGDIPFFYLPYYAHSLKVPFMHVRFIPGKSRDWGEYLLSAWRLNLTPNQTARIYLDYRSRLGIAEGFGLNYVLNNLGRGDYKFYYTQERTRRLPQPTPAEFERYLVRLRHNWDINAKTNAILEFNKIKDTKRMVLGTEHHFLKDYFYREYEKESQPKTYLSVNQNFPNSSLNLLIQKRINPWYTHQYMVPDEKLPQISYNLLSFPLGINNLYLNNRIQLANLLNKEASPSAQDDNVVRFDIYNQIFIPTKLSIFNINPFIAIRETYYSKDKEGNSLDPRTVFYTGLDMNTYFYRIFNYSNNFFEIYRIKHSINPNVKYLYNHRPTIPSSKLQIFDEVDNIESNHKLNLELINKFQTQRNNKIIDFAIFRINTDYNLKRNTSVHKGLADFLTEIELIPFSWLRIETDNIYDPKQDNFEIVNFDLTAKLGENRSLGLGHRYERKGGKELTTEFNWYFNPKWKARIYERYQFADVKIKGLKEQEYSISRDLHCWIMDFIYNISKDHGHTFWFVFRLKAFPAIEIELEQSYRSPKQNTE